MTLRKNSTVLLFLSTQTSTVTLIPRLRETFDCEKGIRVAYMRAGVLGFRVLGFRGWVQGFGFWS